MRKRVVIVGNALPSKNMALKLWELRSRSKRNESYLAKFINDSDYVFRINLAPTFDKSTGIKTDCLVLLNCGKPVIDWCCSVRFNPLLISTTEQILFSKPKEGGYCKATANFPLIFNEDFSKYLISFQNLHEKPISFIKSELYKELVEEVNPEGVYSFIPSSGYIALRYVIKSHFFKNWDIYIVGFSWEGWIGHNWEYEQKYFIDCEKNKILKILNF